jgi:hypothetical protein
MELKNKFLDIVGLTQLVSEIKTRLANNAAASKLMSATYANDTITLTQGGENGTAKNEVTVSLTTATADKNGLMSKEQVAELGRLNTDKLDKVALRIDGKDHASLFSTTTANGKQIAVIDYTTKFSGDNDDWKTQAPTAGAVATALGTKVDNETYSTKVAALEKSITDNKKAADDALALKVDKSTYATDKAAIEKSIEDGLALKVDKTTYDSDKQKQTTKDEGQDALIAKHEDMLYKTGTTATNVYNKSEVDTAIATAKAAIVGGDDNAQLQETYKTLIAISNWIESNDGADDAAGLTKDVATLKQTTATHTSDIEELKGNVEAILGTDSTGISLTSLDARLDTVESDLNTATTGIKAKLATAETDITNLKSELDTAGTGIKARLTAAEDDIDTLEGKMQAAEENISKNTKAITDLDTKLDNAKADKTAAIGSVDDLDWDEATNSYKLVFKSVSGATLDTVSFSVFTADDITALFQ